MGLVLGVIARIFNNYVYYSVLIRAAIPRNCQQQLSIQLKLPVNQLEMWASRECQTELYSLYCQWRETFRDKARRTPQRGFSGFFVPLDERRVTQTFPCQTRIRPHKYKLSRPPSRVLWSVASLAVAQSRGRKSHYMKCNLSRAEYSLASEN